MMWFTIFLLGMFFSDPLTAMQFSHGQAILNVDNGILRRIIHASSPNLDLSSLNLRIIEAGAFDRVPGAKSLDLSNNYLESIPPLLFTKLSQLETLSLADNNILLLEAETFKGLNHLNSLNISNNRLKQLGRGVFGGLSRAVSIITEGNDLDSFPADIFAKPADHTEKTDEPAPVDQAPDEDPAENEPTLRLKICKTGDGVVESLEELKPSEPLGDCEETPAKSSMRRLKLTSLGLKGFRKGWYKVSTPSVYWINLSHNEITEITPELLNDLPETLNYMDLNNNKIEVIRNNGIENFHLEYINLSDNLLSSVEEGALAKTKLLQFEAASNRLDNLNFLKVLPSTLEHLALPHNGIRDIPEDSLTSFTNLNRINLAHNNITQLPVNALRGLKKIQVLLLANNQLSVIEPGTFEDQGNINLLLLESNRITEINSGFSRGLKWPMAISFDSNGIKKISAGAFNNFEEESRSGLYIANNEIEIIEQGSFAGVGIQVIILRNNRISSIPDGAFATPALKYLDLSQNLLTTIGENLFVELSQLERLSLHRNQLRDISKGAFKNLSQLIGLDLSENPMERLENGTLYGVRQEASVNISKTPIRVIEGGLFDDV